MGKRRKALESSLELVEDQYFQSLETIDSSHRLAQTVKDRLVTGECLELLSDLGEVIQAWTSYSDFAYRHLEEWPVYAEEREIAALARLLRRACPKACQAGEAKADD